MGEPGRVPWDLSVCHQRNFEQKLFSYVWWKEKGAALNTSPLKGSKGSMLSLRSVSSLTLRHLWKKILWEIKRILSED